MGGSVTPADESEHAAPSTITTMSKPKTRREAMAAMIRRAGDYSPQRAAPALIALMLAAAAACNGSPEAPVEPDAPSVVGSLPTGEVDITTHGAVASFAVEIAETPETRAKGLMFVEDVPRGYGMVFTYDRPSEGTFWMKNTLVPLEIAFWDVDRVVIAVFSMEPCIEDPCPGYGPDSAYVGAIETAAGELGEAGVAPGSQVTLRRGGDTQP